MFMVYRTHQMVYSSYFRLFSLENAVDQPSIYQVTVIVAFYNPYQHCLDAIYAGFPPVKLVTLLWWRYCSVSHWLCLANYHQLTCSWACSSPTTTDSLLPGSDWGGYFKMVQGGHYLYTQLHNWFYGIHCTQRLEAVLTVPLFVDQQSHGHIYNGTAGKIWTRALLFSRHHMPEWMV